MALRWLLPKSGGPVGVVSTPLLHIHPFIFSCSFQQDLCLIKLLSFIIIKEKCGGRALQAPHNENQIAEPAGRQGGLWRLARHRPSGRPLFCGCTEDGGPRAQVPASCRRWWRAHNHGLSAVRGLCAQPAPDGSVWGLRASPWPVWLMEKLLLGDLVPHTTSHGNTV